MSRLTVFPDNAPDNVELDTEDGAVIAERMKEIGVTFERWTPKGILPKDADDKAVMEAYAEDIERIKKIGGYNTVDVVPSLFNWASASVDWCSGRSTSAKWRSRRSRLPRWSWVARRSVR